jgi:hypothetical protein
VSDDEKPVPQPGEAHREEDEIHYYEVDETKVGDAGGSEKPRPGDKPPPEAAE